MHDYFSLDFSFVKYRWDDDDGDDAMNTWIIDTRTNQGTQL